MISELRAKTKRRQSNARLSESTGVSKAGATEELNMNQSLFPQDFIWGAASASAQVEGGWDCGGRTPSIWDVADPKHIKRGEDCRTACDHFHRMKEDVALMKQMGLKAYRFSVSWSRVIPEEGKVNPEGLQFYSDLVDELIAAGIEPMITIFHWDLPVWVYKKGGWLTKKIVPLFAEYTRVLVEALSDRVRWWMTINEPQCFITNGYLFGHHAPFKHRPSVFARVSKNCLLAHAASVRMIREKAKRPPKVGVAMASGCFVPRDDSPEELEYARKDSVEQGRGLLGNRWWCDPILAGKPVRRGMSRISRRTAKEAYEPLDFVGLNLYQPFNFSDWQGCPQKPDPGMPRTSVGWAIDARVMYWTPKFFYERYGLPIMITENGMSDNDCVCLDGCVHDAQRTDFIRRYLAELGRAISDGVPVIGYLHWSVMDNFEWSQGYDPRFGLIYVDYPTGKRTLKDSAFEYKKIIESGGADI